MNIRYDSAVIFVSDVQQSKDFYTSVLGLEIKMDMGKNVILQNGIALWEIRENNIIPKTIGLDKIKNKGNGFELYFETEDLPANVKDLDSLKVSYLHHLHEEPWGQKTVRIYDPDGNIIEIGESLRGFLSRMKNSGMAIEEIMQKTGMKKEDILSVLSG